jgi:hypothetical protein
MRTVLLEARRKPYQFDQDKSRTGLQAETFYSFIFNKLNMAYFNEMDFAAFVKLWTKKKGTKKMGIAKERIRSKSAPKVVRRQLATKTGTFFYKN